MSTGAASGLGYTVTSITRTQTLGPTGNLVPSYEVHFDVDGVDSSSYVTVPAAGDWEQAALDLIAREVVKIRTLFGG